MVTGDGKDLGEPYVQDSPEGPSFVAFKGKVPPLGHARNSAKLKSTGKPAGIAAAQHLDNAYRLADEAGLLEMLDSNELDFTGKTVVITGGASGIGLEAVRRFTLAGAKVIAIDINPQLKEKINQLNTPKLTFDSVQPIVADVGKHEQWLEQLQKLPKVDVLINVAAIIDPPLELKDPESSPTIKDLMRLTRTPEGAQRIKDDAFKVFNSNFMGPYMLCLAAADKMIGNSAPFEPDDVTGKETRRGVIINVGSTNVSTLNDRRPVYAPQKEALNIFTKLLAKALAPYGITAHCVSPGATADTAIIRDAREAQRRMPLGINKPKNVVDAMMFLASEGAKNMTGQTLAVDGGRTVSMR